MNQNEVIDIDEAIESGDPDLMEKALQQAEAAEIRLGSTEEAKPEESQEEQTEAKGDEADAEGDQDEGAQTKVIKSKNGGHEIPYSVLEEERRIRQETQDQLQETLQKLQELEQQYSQTQESLENVKTRLEEQGADVEEMFANPNEITESQWQELENDYGVLGKLMKRLISQQSSNQHQINQAQADAQAHNDAGSVDVQGVINQNAELSNWQQSDPDRWTEAVRIDEQLKNDPAWASKSLQERFTHVVELTKKSFGDAAENAKNRAKDAIQTKAEQEPPSSLSDLGQAPISNKSDIEALRDMSPERLEAEMAKMSQDQIDALFAQGF